MTGMDDMDKSSITQRAAEWFVIHRGGAVTARERAEFVAWLKSSPTHVREYLAVAQMSRGLTEAARTAEMELEALLSEATAEERGKVIRLAAKPAKESGTANSRIRRPWAYIATAAALAGLSLATIFFMRDGEWLGLPHTYATAHAEQSSWRLPDGSVMHLNSDSRVTVRYSEKERLISLERGQAHFQVAHNALRKFRVATQSADVIAVGTAFDVYRKADATVVTVVEGKVAVVPQSSGASRAMTAKGTEVPGARVGEGPLGSAAAVVELTAGQRVEMSQMPASRPTQANIRESTAWLQREIMFDQQRLADVAAEFNRYSRMPIEIDDPQLQELRLSGTFNAYDTESFIAFLRRLNGVRVEESDDHIEVRR